jgi:putative transcriptional regulator
MRNIVKLLRKEKGLTQEELAQNLSVTRQTINAIENNKYNPTLELALKIARFLEMSVEKIFYID